MWPRWTSTPSVGTSQILMVLFWEALIASERSLPTFVSSTSNASDELHVGDVVVAERDVHQAGDRPGRVSVPVVLHALDQRGGAVAHAHNCYSYRTHANDSFLVLLSVQPCD